MRLVFSQIHRTTAEGIMLAPKGHRCACSASGSASKASHRARRDVSPAVRRSRRCSTASDVDAERRSTEVVRDAIGAAGSNAGSIPCLGDAEDGLGRQVHNERPATGRLRAVLTRGRKPRGPTECAIAHHEPRYSGSLGVPFRIVQPWGRDKGREATLVSEHPTVSAAFAEIDRLAAEMLRTGARTDSVELLVVDADGRILSRPDAH